MTFPQDPSGPVMADQEGINALDRWASEHRQAARTIQAFTYAGMVWLAGLVWDVFHFIAYAVVAAWTGGLIIMNWKTAWVRPLWERTRDTAKRLYSWTWAALEGRLFSWRSAERRTAEVVAEEESVQRALAMDTPEADMQLASQRHAFAQQLDGLLALPVRDYHQELQAAHLGRMIKKIDVGRFGSAVVERIRSDHVAARPQGFFGPVAGSKLWVAAGAAFLGLLALLGFQTARLENAKSDLREAQAEANSLERALADTRAVNADLAENIARASEGAQEAAETIQTERARSNAARRRERELVREIQERTANVGEPPAWGLRNDASSDPAGPSDGASGHPGDLSR